MQVLTYVGPAYLSASTDSVFIYELFLEWGKPKSWKGQIYSRGIISFSTAFIPGIEVLRRNLRGSI